MNNDSAAQIELMQRVRDVIQQTLPLPGSGETRLRHRQLFDLGRESLSLARLAEAHFDAVAILAEQGRPIEHGCVYGVWAAEIIGQPLRVNSGAGGLSISGTKRFCSGAGLVDHALVTSTDPEDQLLDIDLRKHAQSILYDCTSWKVDAFRDTNTATVTFNAVPLSHNDFVGPKDWYSSRPGFWHGACGPAACWAGGAAALVDWALKQKRDDAHTTAHLGAMSAQVWSLRATLDTVGDEIDSAKHSEMEAKRLALTVRHIVEQACSDVLHRLTRAFGPHPLAMNAEISRCYQELDLYLRQSHAERDLEVLGWLVRDTDG